MIAPFGIALAAAVAIVVPSVAQAAAAGNPTTDVTAMQVVQRDLTLAATYWQTAQPSLSAPCAERVLLAPMLDATGNDGAVIAAKDIWAETDLGGCTIDISGSMWQAILSQNAYEQYAVCTTIAHELAHTLGLADSAKSPGQMLNQDPGPRRDPLCRRAVYGWHGLAR
jgi:hypothetical protein